MKFHLILPVTHFMDKETKAQRETRKCSTHIHQWSWRLDVTEIKPDGRFLLGTLTSFVEP